MRGIYQWCGDQALTKYDMVQIMAKTFGLSSEHVVADASPGGGAPRPRDVTMKRDKLLALDIAKHTPFEEGCKNYLVKFAVKK